MLDFIKIPDILFLDIETVPQHPAFKNQSEIMQELWEKKSSFFRKEDESASDVYQRAGIYAEFGKIICVSVGIITEKENNRKIRLKSFWGDDEKKLLEEFKTLLENYNSKKNINLCAHNGKEFDFPYLARRMLINGITLPGLLDIAGKKPWEINLLDTMELWKFGDYKHYTSLKLLTSVFGIPSPKDEIDGSMVSEIYWGKKDLNAIVTYCQKDVVAIAQLLLRYKGLDLIAPENIEIADQ
ncbi:MAG: 3'-5' exonuclease [Bacteroidales bacterium]|nr:3'-5' exonuclease [Bacteroidales bacterium]